MRVTEARLIEIASSAANKGLEKLAEVSDIASSGVSVARPSQDPVKWTEGTRADARNTMSASRGSTIARADERLTTADQTMQTMDTVLQRAVELATQMANGVYNAQNRKDAATEIQALHDSALSSANVQDNNGQYVFSGTQGNTPPFDAKGVYKGDATISTVETAEHEKQQITVPGTIFTTASGVDVFQTLNNLVAALNNNDPNAVRNTLPDIKSAINQISSGRAVIGTRQAALKQAESDRQDFENTLAEAKTRTTAADPVAAASELAKGKLAFDTAQALSQQIMSVLKNL